MARRTTFAASIGAAGVALAMASTLVATAAPVQSDAESLEAPVTVNNATIAEGDVSPFIIGGEELKDISENPGAVGLHVKIDDPNSTGLVCGATRIGPKWALTARHCIKEQKDYTLESISSYSIDRRYGPKIHFDHTKIVYYPEANVDAALIPLDEAGPGMIAQYSTRTPDTGETVVSMGYGQTGVDSTDTTVMKKANVQVTGVGKATGVAPGGYDGGDHIFTQGINGRCWRGDSGGPLWDSQNKLIGITGWGNRPNSDDEITGRCGYVHLGYIANWVQEVTGIAPDTPQETIPLPDDEQPGEPTPEPTPEPTGEFSLPFFP